MKRIIPSVLLLAVMLTAVSFAACGGDDDAVVTPTQAVATTASVGTLAGKTAAGETAVGTKAGATTAAATPGSPAAEWAKDMQNATTTPSGLKYVDEVVGTGSAPKVGRSVTVSYIGTFINGTKFDASADHGGTFSFVLGQGNVIKGWDEGVASMKVGGTRLLYVPSALAYGTRGNGPIPPNTDIIFEVKLISVQQ